MASYLADAQQLLQGSLAELQLLTHGLLQGMRGDAAGLSSTTPDASRDLRVIVALALVCFAINWGTRLLLVEPVLRSFYGMKSLMVRKCAQSVMEAAFYGGFSLIGAFVVPAQPWVWPSAEWWRGFLDGHHVAMRDDLRCYYLLYMARYAQMVFSVLLEPKRKDFLEMMLHHLVTVFVIWVSYIYGFNRVGVVTMLLLDPADVPLHVAKVGKYLFETTHNTAWRFLSDRAFEGFAFSFGVTRLGMYGYVVWSAFVEGFHFIPEPPLSGYICLLMLLILLVLQFYWFALIMRVAIQVFFKGGEVEDTRSDDEGENTPDASPNTRKRNQLWRLAYALPVLSVFIWQCNVASQYPAGLAGLDVELRVLFRGLAAAVAGGAAAAAAQPSAAPELQRDSCVFVALTLALFAANWGVRLFIAEPMIRCCLRLSPSQLAKYAQSIMEALIYGGFMLVGARVVASQEWVWPSSSWWLGFADGGHEIMRSDLRCFYLLYISRYFQAIFSVLLEARRKDFVEMIIHHVVTVVVIYISYLHGWNRVGVVVMVLLDPADVPLHLAKLCKYTAEATKRHGWQFLADRLFELFAVVFFATRLVMYGYVCWSAHVEATRYFPKGLPEWTCVALLYTLLLLQIYWFFLIIKVAMRLLSGHGADDIRSDDEAEGQDANGAAAPAKAAAGAALKKETKKGR